MTTPTVGGPFPRAEGGEYINDRLLAFDTSYATGGMALTFAQLGYTIQPRRVFIPPKQGYTFEYVMSTQKVIVYQGDNTNAAAAPGIEVANATSLVALAAVPVHSQGAYTA